MHLWQVSLAGDSWSLIEHLIVTSSGAPNFNVADSLDDAYLGPFIDNNYKALDQNSLTSQSFLNFKQGDVTAIGRLSVFIVGPCK